MLTDRISLNIALECLNRFDQIEGTVSNILFSRKEELSQTSKTVKFDDIEVLRAFINKYTPIMTYNDSDCSVMGLYELKSFSVADKNLILLGTEGFYTKSSNIKKSLIEDLNTKYTSNISEVNNVFGEIRIDEYILNQVGYIDCGYIELHFEEAMNKIKQLYNKYKQI